MTRLTIIFIILSLSSIIACDGQQQQNTKLKVISYNVYFGKQHNRSRYHAILKMIENNTADIIAIQESTLSFKHYFYQSPAAKIYHNSFRENEIKIPGGLTLLSKYPLEQVQFIPLPGRMNRGLLLAKVKINGMELWLATVHLESMLNDGAIRKAQLQMIYRLLNPYKNVILAGDFNFGDGEEPESSVLSKDFKDSWLVLNYGKPGLTWDKSVNPMAAKNSFPDEGSRRLDRIFVKSAQLKADYIKIIGKEAVDNEKKVFPSDHFGLLASYILIMP